MGRGEVGAGSVGRVTPPASGQAGESLESQAEIRATRKRWSGQEKGEVNVDKANPT